MLKLIDHLQRREVIGIDGGREEPIRDIPCVAYADPHRLDTPVPEGRSKEYLDLRSVRNRDRNLDRALTLGVQRPCRLLSLEPAP